MDLRKECTERLVEIGFDGLGYGGWPVKNSGGFNYEVAELIAENTPKSYLLYGLGIGKPEEVAGCVKRGWQIFDCVLPTRDARHKRMYIYEADTREGINPFSKNFYSYYSPDKEKYYRDTGKISKVCDCQLCRNYSRSYFAHLWRAERTVAGRLATIHNLRFYSMLMEKLQERAAWAAARRAIGTR